MDTALNQVGRTLRYALSNNARSMRLATLMLIAIISWHYVM